MKSRLALLAAAALVTTGALAAPPSPGVPPPSKILAPTLEQRIGALEARVVKLEEENARLRSALEVTPTGDVTLKSQPGRALTVSSGKDLTISAKGDAQVEAQARLDLSGTSNAKLRSSGTAEVVGPLVRVNSGSKPVARKAGNSVEASPTVLVP